MTSVTQNVFATVNHYLAGAVPNLSTNLQLTLSLGNGNGSAGDVASLEVRGTEVEATAIVGRGVEVDAAGVAAHARGELLEVVDGLEHCCCSSNSESNCSKSLMWRTPHSQAACLRFGSV